jgi:hypothetical protein
MEVHSSTTEGELLTHLARAEAALDRAFKAGGGPGGDADIAQVRAYVLTASGIIFKAIALLTMPVPVERRSA